MTVILVLALFVSFLVIERITSKKAPEYVCRPRLAPRPKRARLSRSSPVMRFPNTSASIRVMPGRLGESPNLVRAGIDDFAAKLIGEAEEINLPQRGQWIRQGQKVWSFRVNGELMEMVSPIEGTVSDVNDEVVRHPESLTADPYGNSWLMTVQSPDAKTNFRNLLGGNMARNLMRRQRQEAGRLHTEANMALAQDGGKAHGEIAKQLPAGKYVEITKEFFLA